MTTNFEFYKTKLLSSIFEGDFCIKKDGSIGICSETLCNECLLYEFTKNGHCNGEVALKWANTEHIELPKLTKRERAFCEAMQTGWIARDKCGLYLYESEPIKNEFEWICDIEYNNWDFPESISNMFTFVKWEDEKPWAIEELLKLEVQEE